MRGVGRQSSSRVPPALRHSRETGYVKAPSESGNNPGIVIPAFLSVIPAFLSVIPAKAGIQEGCGRDTPL